MPSYRDSTMMTPEGEQFQDVPAECREAFSAARLLQPGSSPHCTTAELLATMLPRTSVECCRRLVAVYGSLRRLANATSGELRQLGLPPSACDRLAMLFEVAKRFGEEQWLPGAPFRGSYDVYAHFREHLAAETVEHFIVVLLDQKHRKLKDVLVSKGSLTSAIIHPRDVYLPAIRESAAAVVFCHQHPSGDPTPSREDIDITKRLREVGELIGIRVLDHVIIGKGRYVSFTDDGYW